MIIRRTAAVPITDHAVLGETSDEIAAGMLLLFCATNLERIGDHVTNIAESATS